MRMRGDGRGAAARHIACNRAWHDGLMTKTDIRPGGARPRGRRGGGRAATLSDSTNNQTGTKAGTHGDAQADQATGARGGARPQEGAAADAAAGARGGRVAQHAEKPAGRLRAALARPIAGDQAAFYVAGGLAVLAAILLVVGLVSSRVEARESAEADAAARSALTVVSTPQTSSGSSLATLASRYDGMSLARGRSSAVLAAIQPIVAPYGDAVSVAYVPVGYGEAAFSVNGATQHVAASMIKMLVLATLLDEAQRGVVSLQDEVEVTSDDIVDGSGVLKDDGADTSHTLEELARLMIDVSDNVATNKLIDVLGKDAINQEAATLGLTGTVLRNRLMTDDTTDGYNLTCADDLATIFELIATDQLVSPEMSELARDVLAGQTIDQGLAAGVPDGVTVAHKTGMLENVSHDGGIVYADEAYVLVVMTDGIQNDEAVKLTEEISRAAYAANAAA